MTTIPTPLWMQAVSGETAPQYGAQSDRALIDNEWSYPGVIGPFVQSTSGAGSGPLAVQQRGAGANLSVDVLAGACIVAGTDSTGQGKYLCPSPTGTVNLPNTAGSPPAGQSRIDLVVAKVTDAQNVGGTTSAWTPAWVYGTNATTGSQVAPAVPASALPLASVLLGPTITQITNAMITDLRVPAMPNTGLYGASALGVGGFGTYDGQPLLVQAGAITGTTNAVGAVFTSFPRPFPNGVLTVHAQNVGTNVSGTPVYMCCIISGQVTKSGFWCIFLTQGSSGGSFSFLASSPANSGYVAFGY